MYKINISIHFTGVEYNNFQADTSRVIWAYHSLDPSSDNSLGSLRHEKMGSTSLNLLGGSNKDRVEPNSDFFILNNNNVSLTTSTFSNRAHW